MVESDASVCAKRLRQLKEENDAVKALLSIIRTELNKYRVEDLHIVNSAIKLGGSKNAGETDSQGELSNDEEHYVKAVAQLDCPDEINQTELNLELGETGNDLGSEEDSN